jgi:hypothetical protein
MTDQLADPQRDELDLVFEAGCGNFQESKRVYPDEVALVEDFVQLYKYLAVTNQEAFQTSINEIYPASQFLTDCRLSLLLGASDVLRGNLTASYTQTRRAIEICAFSSYIQREPSRFETWVHADESEENYWKYRRAFSSKEIFRRDDPALVELEARYTRCSRMSHPTVQSIRRKIRRVEEGERAGQFAFVYHELSNDNIREPRETLFWILETHLHIIGVFERLLNGVLEPKREDWNTLRIVASNKLTILSRKLKYDVALQT